MDSTPTVTVRGLRKKYLDRTLVGEIDLDVDAGESSA
jgi:ABC-type multidrug transport system ATPase subunit